MVRYPHTATVTASVVTVTDGEYVTSSDTETSITGRLQTTGAPRRIKDQAGDWIDVSTMFFTRSEKIENAEKLTVDGVVYKIVSWQEKQLHSKIWLD